VNSREAGCKNHQDKTTAPNPSGDYLDGSFRRGLFVHGQRLIPGPTDESNWTEYGVSSDFTKRRYLVMARLTKELAGRFCV
jgi:hypothetical protein